MSAADPQAPGCADFAPDNGARLAPPSALSGPHGSHTYPRARRILKTDEFSSVFSLRPVQRSVHFVLYVRASEGPQARLGVVAAKRFAPRAVTRNTIKRVTREIFRQSAPPACDCIVRLSKPVNTKADPATSSRLKSLLRRELSWLFRSHFEGEKQGEKRR